MRVLALSALLVFIACLGAAAAAPVAVARMQSVPVLGAAPICNATSAFPYTYNPSWFVTKARPQGCLLVRVQNATSPTNPTPGPSSLAASCIVAGAGGNGVNADPLLSFTSLSFDDVVFGPATPLETYGTEDPRMVERNGTFYLFYTAVQKKPNGDWVARLSLATTTDPLTPSLWQRQGPLFPDVNGFQFTKSGALLVDHDHPTAPAYLIFGDCSLYNGLQVAVASPDLLQYQVLEDLLLVEMRPGDFDSGLVESGPPPMKLDDGNWLFIYNAAQRLYGVPNTLLYNPGWVILNGSNPLQVLQRSDVPLVMPQHYWETQGLTPFVIFVEAMRYVDAGATRNKLVAYYGAADTSIGALSIVVEADAAADGRPRYRVSSQ